MKKGVGIILFFVTLYLVYFFVVRHQRQIHYKRAKETCSKYFSNVDKKYTNQEELFPPKNEYNCSEILNEHKSNLKFCSTEKTAMLKGLFYVFSINQICDIDKYKSYNEKYSSAVDASGNVLIAPNRR
tara:strand:- start:4625 stop:5008 length:384 start_codon:yes stop_codon:yes gene_type:complete